MVTTVEREICESMSECPSVLLLLGVSLNKNISQDNFSPPTKPRKLIQGSILLFNIPSKADFF